MNLAVNNLLSRDDEGDDDNDEAAETYMSGDYINYKRGGGVRLFFNYIKCDYQHLKRYE